MTACATYRTKYAHSDAEEALTESDTEPPVHTVYLIGDAGESPIGGKSPALIALGERLGSASENSHVVFLGDNIYPAGMPPRSETEDRAIAENHLDAQLNILEGYPGDAVFIPGNHDWYSNGPAGVQRQERYIEKALGKGSGFLPDDGCPLASVELSEDLLLVVVDSQWFVEDWDRHPGINDDCEIKDRERFFDEVEGLIKKNGHRTVMIAVHNPVFTYGPHGGRYTFRQHVMPYGLPLPGIGSMLNILRKTTGVSHADVQHPRYRELRNRLATLAQGSDRVVFVSGHEHGLQYNVVARQPQIVSGSGSLRSGTRMVEGSRFSTGHAGYAVFQLFADGRSEVVFHGIDTRNGGTESVLYRTPVLGPVGAGDPTGLPYEPFPASVKASVYEPERTEKGKFYRGLWGERYRRYYATEVEAPTVLLDTLYGGLEPVRKGGGHQSRSLRLRDPSGRQWVMRALEKSAERYLQAIAFQDRYVIGEFEGTATESFIQDFYTGAHPYAPFTTATLSSAVGVYHTNPELFYVPRQAALGRYNEDFGDELYMIEEHVSDGHGDLESFGYPEKIESSTDMMAKLRRDPKYHVDQKAFVRARLFDILIGDWDRHPDQWRWVEREIREDSVTFTPIPRDRDQAYSIMGDGNVLGLAMRFMPSLRIFEGFGPEVRDVSGLNASPLTHAQDVALLSGVPVSEWEAQAYHIQARLDADVVNRAFEGFPEAVRDSTVERIKGQLLQRSQELVEYARAYHAHLSRYVVLTGTDKDELFEISAHGDGGLRIEEYNLKDGKRGALRRSVRVDPKTTREVWIYGLDDDDRFEVRAPAGPISVRLIGGHGDDRYSASGGIKVHGYDFRSEERDKDGVREHRSDDYDTHTYRFQTVKADTYQWLPVLDVNPDDGLRIGLSATYTHNGFRQNPFTQRHGLSAVYALATSGFDIRYKGEIAHVFEGVNLALDARWSSPNFSENFFGFSNDSPNLDDDLGLDFNRVRIGRLELSPHLVFRGDLGSETRLGPTFARYRVDRTPGRFIEDFLDLNPGQLERDYLGITAGYRYGNRDDRAFPTLGMDFELDGGYQRSLSDDKGDFLYLNPRLALYHRLDGSGRVVLATQWQGAFNFGDGFAFYQAPNIGADRGLRGFRFQRFTGKSAYVQTTDIRVAFGKRRTGVLPVTPGFYTGFDYGRVWNPDDPSDTWHTSYGGGFFINGSGILAANLGLFGSSDGARFAFGLNFGF